MVLSGRSFQSASQRIDLVLMKSFQALRSPLWALETLSRNHLFFVADLQKRTIKTVTPYTLLGAARLRSLWELANTIVLQGVEGAFAECGCRDGGSGALLAKVASEAGRTTWLFDSFEGLPAPSAVDVTVSGELGAKGDYLGSETQVHKVLGLLGVELSEVQIVKGWFNDTLAHARTGPIAFLHIDVDLHDSTMTVLEALYDRVAPRGIVVFDDYAYWRGSKKAVDAFLSGRSRPTIHRSGYPSVWIRKPS